MLKAENGVYCGVFDSRILRGAQTRSTDRRVLCYELELFHTDTGISHINGAPYPTRRGMLLCAKPGQIRFSCFPVRCSFIRIPPSEQGGDPDIEAVLRAMPDCAQIGSGEETDELMALFTRLSACFVSSVPAPLNDLRINALLTEILYRANRHIHRNPDAHGDLPVSRITQEAYEYINENYASDCSLQTLANAVGISPNHLHSVFSREMGVTPYEYALRKRIDQAKKRIVAGEKSMLEIALETGFCSQSHFNRVFRQKTSMTPVEYRRRLLEQYAGPVREGGHRT